MFKEKIEQTVKNIIANLDMSGDFVAYNDLSDLQLDDFVIKFIQAEINWWIYEDRILRMANKSFDFSGLDDDSVNQEIDNIYRNKVKISKHELEILISKAVKLRANYLIKPKNCLITFCFFNSAKISKLELELKLAYFIDYYYLIEGINSWLSTKDKNSKIFKMKFQQKLSEIESKNIKTLDGLAFMQLLENCWMFFENDNNEIHSDVMKLFFEDKNMLDIANQIKKFAKENDKIYLSQAELQDFLMNIEANPDEDESEIDEEEIIEEVEEISEEKYDFINEEDAELLVNEIKLALKTLAKNEDINSIPSESNKIAEPMSQESDLLPEVHTENVIEVEEKESVDVSKILEAEDGTELSTDDIEALFNQ